MKPEEPTGLDAVVEDADGLKWVRWTRSLDPGIKPWRPVGVVGWRRDFADVAAVRVLSEGESA